MKRLPAYLSLMLAFFVVACGNDSKPTQATQPAQEALLFPAGKAVAAKDHGANHPPSFNSSPKDYDLTILLPNGPAALLEFAGEPATDPDGDDISYRFAFAVPSLFGLQTPAEALLRITREGNSFAFQGDGEIVPAQFTPVYGATTILLTLRAGIYASDGTAESDPELFDVSIVYDGSAQFSTPAEYMGEQRWESPTPIELYEGATMPASEDLPTWTAVTAQPRQWRLENWSPPTIRCEIVTIFDPYTLPDGGDDNALFSLDSAERATAGTVSLAFKTVPDYEMPGDSNADNEYQVRVVNTHNIHYLDGEGTPTGCSGSVLDVTIRVKDVGVPMPPKKIAAVFQETDDTKIDVNWTASTGFSENGNLVEFPASFEVTDYDYRYRPDGATAWTEVTDTDLTATTVTLEDLTEDAYEIQVRANNSEGRGAWSSTIRAEQVKHTLCFMESHYTVIEGDPAGVEIAVYLDPAAGALPIAIPIAVTEKDGAGHKDYAGVPSRITFAPGESMQTFTLVATEDSDHDEGIEAIQLSFGDLPKNVIPETPATAEVTLLDIMPVIVGLEIISTPENGTTYGRGEIIKVEVTFNMPVVVTGIPYLTLELDRFESRWARYQQASYPERIVFQYRVSARDRDRNGVSIPSAPLFVLGGASITAVSSGVNANIFHGSLPDDPNHKVNGSLRDK